MELPPFSFLALGLHSPAGKARSTRANRHLTLNVMKGKDLLLSAWTRNKGCPILCKAKGGEQASRKRIQQTDRPMRLSSPQHNRTGVSCSFLEIFVATSAGILLGESCYHGIRRKEISPLIAAGFFIFNAASRALQPTKCVCSILRKVPPGEGYLLGGLLALPPYRKKRDRMGHPCSCRSFAKADPFPSFHSWVRVRMTALSVGYRSTDFSSTSFLPFAMKPSSGIEP